MMLRAEPRFARSGPVQTNRARAIVAGELRRAAMLRRGLTVNKPDNPVFARVIAVAERCIGLLTGHRESFPQNIPVTFD